MSAKDRDVAAGTAPIRVATRLPVVLLLSVIVPGTLSACGGSPMRVEQRYVEPKSPEQTLQEKANLAKQRSRAHGEAPGTF